MEGVGDGCSKRRESPSMEPDEIGISWDINEALNGITRAPNFGSQDGEGIPPNVFFFWEDP